ncbi:MAG TPA: phosphotransferase [Acidimicrobiales bacterium]
MLLVERPVAASIDELLQGATERRPMTASDSKSGARFERVWIDGRPHVVKHLHVDDDWIMRATGDLGCRPVQVWRSGILDQLPPCIDHAVVGAAAGLGRDGWGAALLMRDLSPSLVPEGNAPVPLEQHLVFLDHMAALHTTFWGWTDNVGLAPPHHRYLEFSPEGVSLEAQRGWPDPVPPLIIEGWKRFATIGGPIASPVLDLAHDPSPLVDALATAPSTLLHGDWKLGNLGSLPDGRTVLLDWAVPGQGCPTAELAWYLAINAARLPHSREAAIAAYRASLERHGVATSSWWDRALALSLLGGLVQFGWEKALGGPGAELAWWLGRGADGLACL